MKKDSREILINSARELMMKKGKDGVRMQQIADHAGVNKGLLHYYFKSKEKIFTEVFKQEFEKFYAPVNRILLNEMHLNDKLAIIIEHYHDSLLKDPHTPVFIISEISRNPKLIKEMSEEHSFISTAHLLDKQFKIHGFITSPVYALQVLLNIIGMSVFPFMIKPLIEEKGDQGWEAFVSERKDFLKSVVINSFK